MKIALLLVALAALLPAQEFEVASIHPAKDDGNQDSDVDQGRYSAHNLTLKRLMARAWDVDESEILGGPAWIDSDSYDINARIPAEYSKATREQVLHMLRSLLTDRFQLEVHRNAAGFRIRSRCCENRAEDDAGEATAGWLQHQLKRHVPEGHEHHDGSPGKASVA